MAMNQRSDRAVRTSLWRLHLNANTVNDCLMQRRSTRVNRFRASAVAFPIVRFPSGPETAQGRQRLFAAFRCSRSATAEQEAEQRKALLKLVRERNRLIHRDALDVDLSSPEQSQLSAQLDEQNERIRAQLLHLNSLRQAHREAHEELVPFMQTDEFLSVLQGQGDDAQYSD